MNITRSQFFVLAILACFGGFWLLEHAVVPVVVVFGAAGSTGNGITIVPPEEYIVPEPGGLPTIGFRPGPKAGRTPAPLPAPEAPPPVGGPVRPAAGPTPVPPVTAEGDGFQPIVPR